MAQSQPMLNKIGNRIQWVNVYVTSDKSFFVYIANGEKKVHKHTKLSGFALNKICEVKFMLNPNS